MAVTSQPFFCGSCHEMRPEYTTWTVSTHQKVSCVACHIQPGAKNFIEHKVEALNQVYQHIFKKYYLPIEIKGEIPSATCLQCHSVRRDVTPERDIKIPHDVHYAKGISCMTCHRGVAHGQISEREQTIDGKFDRWTPSVARQQLAPQWTSLPMKDCIECHRQRSGPRNCEGCHKEIRKPQSHLQPGFVDQGRHGVPAAENPTECERCHSITNEPIVIKAETPVASYARANSFCYRCHQKEPPGHDKTWGSRHAVVAAQSQRLCLTCHDSNQAPKSARATKTSCNSCHNGFHQNPQRGKEHPFTLQSSQRPGPTCYTCHNQQTCERCHITKK